MKSGSRPTRIKHTDFDFRKTFGSVAPVSFPAEYFCDAGIGMPDQNVLNTVFTPAVPPMPEGCTNYGQSELSTDLDGKLKSPNDLEAVTHANARGGIDIRESLLACLPPSSANPNRLGWFKAFYNIRASGALDYFDAFRLAQFSAQPEKRSISWGTPWFPSWELAAQQGVAIMPMPTPEELQNVGSMPWHDSKLDGWTARNGIVVYRDKSWQGYNVGENGFLFFPREVINVVMAIAGTVAYTASNMDAAPQRIDVNLVQWIVSIIRNLFNV